MIPTEAPDKSAIAPYQAPGAASPRVVIIGAGFGGLAAALALRRAPVRITLLDQRNHHLFQPLLYQVATGGLSPGEIAYPIRAILRRQLNTQVLLGLATGMDPRRRIVQLADGELAYDYLILAPGAQTSYFGHPDWRPAAPGLKDIEDALEIRRRILMAFERAEREQAPERRRQLLTFAIVGGGPTGVELAGAIADIARRVMVKDFRSINPREARILLLEGGPRILPGFDSELSERAAITLHGLGVEVRTGAMVNTVAAGGLTLTAHDRAESLAAGTIIWAAGVAASPLAASLGVALDHGGRVRVEPDLALLDYPECFVIGDLAAFPLPRGGSLPGLAPVAMQQGRAAAANILLDLKGRPRLEFRYVDKGNVAAIGRARAVAEIRGLRLWGWPAWLVWAGVHIAYLIGFRNRVLVLLEWAWDYLSFQQAARLITGRINWTQR